MIGLRDLNHFTLDSLASHIHISPYYFKLGSSAYSVFSLMRVLYSDLVTCECTLSNSLTGECGNLMVKQLSVMFKLIVNMILISKKTRT